MGWIYIATSPSGKSYIGQTTKEKVWMRWREHCHDERGNSWAFHRAIRKYGHWDQVNKTIYGFEMDYYECPNEDLDFDEDFLIENMFTLRPNGYNLVKGGRKPQYCQETLDRRSRSHRTKDFHLPTGVSSIKGGYQARYNSIMRQFTSSKYTDEQRLNAAIYYKQCGETPRWYEKNIDRELPLYINRDTPRGPHAVMVSKKNKDGKLKRKHFSTGTLEENIEQAEAYLLSLF